MIERRKIVDLWQRGDAAALVTLVRVEGSSYRRPGARLLIAANGDYAGAISGGCLEAEVARKAQWKVRDGAIVERFSTLFDDTAEIPYGLGCGGAVDLLLEPSGTPEFTAMMRALAASLSDEPRRVVTELPEHGRPLRRTVFDHDRNVLFSSGGVERGGPVFDDLIEGPQRLYLFGAGDDARPMVQMSALLGWNATVIDSRAQAARRERFPEATRVLCTTSLDGIEVDGNDAVVVMSHSYEQDRAWLAALLPLRPRYLGLLGARHRSALLIAEAAALLGWPLERACEGIFAPVGLDLGGDGAEAIALATIAEIKACCEGKPRFSEPLTADMVAGQLESGGASRYLQTQCAL